MSDPRIDAYIDNAAEWAKPILNHLRTLPIKAVPEATETIKWGSPAWEYKGILCVFSAFKDHCGFVLFNDREIPEIAELVANTDPSAFGALGQITSLEDLPSEENLIKAIQLVAAHNEAKKARPKGAHSTKKAAEAAPVPDDLVAALDQAEAARQQWDGFTVAKQNEYIAWFDEAKTAGTREKRIAQAIEWISEGKSRNWKYMR
jgi:uncharacterized protein YdeI (YjbR/CyaY-like superfamily)